MSDTSVVVAAVTWKVSDVLRGMLRSLRADPLRQLAVLVLIPTLWSVPSELLDALLPEEPSLEPAVLALEVAVLCAMTVWSSLVYGGQVLIALDCARGSKVRWGRFVEGLRYTLPLALTAVPYVFIVFLPLVFFAQVGEDDHGLAFLSLVVTIGAVACFVTLGARTALWAQLMVDGGRPLGRAFAVSWAATRGHVWKMIRLCLVLLVPTCVVFGLERVYWDESRLAFGLLGGLYVLATTHLYLLTPFEPEVAVAPRKLPGDDTGEMDADLPRAGSGWSRPFD